MLFIIQGLVNKDSALLGQGKSDPYATLEIKADGETHNFKTEVRTFPSVQAILYLLKMLNFLQINVQVETRAIAYVTSMPLQGQIHFLMRMALAGCVILQNINYIIIFD